MFKDKKYLFSLLAMIVIAVGSVIIYGVNADNDNISLGDNSTLIINNNRGEQEEATIGGSTSDNWNVGGNLVVDGTANFTGEMTAGTITGAIINSNGGSSTGVYASTTVETTATLLASSITGYSYLAITPNVANTELTLPATSTLSTFIPTAGMHHSIIIENVSSVSATTTTILMGTGMDGQEPDGQNVVIGGNNYAVVTFYRRSDTDMVVTVDEFIPSD